jgi:hypothetical protein
MKLLGMLKRPVLAVAPGRERLRAALADRDKAQQAIIRAQSTIDRVQVCIDAGDEASSRAREADTAAKTALAQWARGGCDPSAEAEHQRLRAAADEAQRIANHAQVAAKAAQAGIVPARSALQHAQSDLRSCEHQINDEVGRILVAGAAPILDRLERLAKELQSCRVEVRGLLDYVECASAEAARAVRAAYCRASATVEPIADFACTPAGQQISAPPAEVLRLAAAWRERAAQLRENPDA